VQAVITDKGRIVADTVVVAMGSFTAPLLAKNAIRVPIYPVKRPTLPAVGGDRVASAILFRRRFNGALTALHQAY
jgi:D-amino-acid dehydrogenase